MSDRQLKRALQTPDPASNPIWLGFYVGGQQERAAAELDLRANGHQGVQYETWMGMSREDQIERMSVRLRHPRRKLDSCTIKAILDGYKREDRPVSLLVADLMISLPDIPDFGLSREYFQNLGPTYVLGAEAEWKLRVSGKARYIGIREWWRLPEHTRKELLVQRLEALGDPNPWETVKTHGVPVC